MSYYRTGPGLVFAAAMMASGVAAQAADSAVCAVEQTVVCAPFEPCARTLPGAVNLPVLMRVDPDAGVVVSRLDNGTERSSKAASMTETDDALTLQGMDEGQPWLMQIARKSGRFSIATARPEESFVAFGVRSASLLK